MNVLQLIKTYYSPGSESYTILVEHSKMVARKAIDIAHSIGHLCPDIVFIEEAAMLHDIGIFLTNEPRLGCFGSHDYVRHGYLGRELLESEGLLKHALVCERHVGVGLSVSDIRRQRLSLPHRDMLPVSLEEKIICYADKFFSKGGKSPSSEKPLAAVRKSILAYGEDKLKTFDNFSSLFNR